MDKTESSKLAKEMAEFCRVRAKERLARSDRRIDYKKVLQVVLGALLAVPAAGDSPDRLSKW